MRRVLVSALATILCLLLCACSGSDTGEITKEIQSTYDSAQRIIFFADMTADYGARTYAFRLRCEANAEEMVIEIIEPEAVAGLTARIKDGEATLEYDGVALNTGELFGDGLSPVEGLPMMLEAWGGGYVSGSWTEKVDDTETVVLETDISGAGSKSEILLRTWFDTLTALPIKAEILTDGSRVICCEFGDVIVE